MKLRNIYLGALFLSIAPFLYSYTGNEYITFANSTNIQTIIYVNQQNKITIPAGQTKKIMLDRNYNYFVMKNAHNTYRISYQSPCQEHLDIKTIMWLAEQKDSSIGYDHIKIHNDMLYTIAVLWKWKQTRSRAQMVEPQETISKVVREEEPQRSRTVHGELFLSLLNPNATKHSFSFSRRVISEIDNTWHEVTLSANTLMAFNDGKFRIE